MAIRNKKKSFFNTSKIFQLLTHSEHLPFTVCFLSLAVLFILIRMKGVEYVYSLNNLNESIDRELILNKEIKAQRAKLLAANKLKELAQKHHLKDPAPEQIILIQD